MVQRRRIRWLTVALVVGVLILQAAGAQEFRIQTEIVVNDSEDSVSENLTLFAQGKVYDFLLTEPKELVIFDANRQSFELLHIGRQKRLSLSGQNVLEFINALKTPELQRKNPFFFAPQFETRFDEQASTLDLVSPQLKYHVTGIKPADPLTVVQYRKFADWYARLNSTAPGRMPPFPRLELNRQLAEQGLIPERVDMTIDVPQSIWRRPLRVTSRHSIIWQLSNTDRRKIEQAGEYLVSFKPVGFREYRELNRQVAESTHK